MLFNTPKPIILFFILITVFGRGFAGIATARSKPILADSALVEKLHTDSLAATVLKPSATLAGNCYDINWATWSPMAMDAMSTAGSIIDADGTSIGVSMSANYKFGTSPDIYGYMKFSGYPSTIPNSTVPKTTWIVGAGGATTMSFSRKVTNPVLLLSSLGGSTGIVARLDFSLPYVVLYNGGGMVYNSSTALTGTEGYAIIMFPGDFNSVTINSSTYEFYTNITWGIRPQPFAINFADGAGSCGSSVVTASGGDKYQWNGGDTPNQATNTFHQSGTYLVTVTNASNCVTSASKVVTVNTSLNATISGNATDCGRVTLTASGGSTYLWDGGVSPNSAVNIFITSGTYTVKVTDANGCSATKSQNVTIIPTTEASISGNSSACGSVTLTASGGNTYLWNGGSNPNSATNTFTTSGVYMVKVTNANGCINTTLQSVTVNTPPVATISGTTANCGNVTLTASGGTSYLWDGGNNPNSAVNTFTTSGTYTVKVTNANGCSATATQTITVNPVPVATISGNTSACGSVTLTASGGGTYLWDGGSNPNSATNTFTASGTYTVTVTGANGCTASASANVTILDPVIVVTGSTTGCTGVTITASGGITYRWDGGNSPNTATNTFNTSGAYTVSVTNAVGCTATAKVNVSIGLPVAVINGDLTGCGSVILTASGGVSYQWDGGSNPNSAVNTFTASGNYSVMVTNINGCTSTASVLVTVNPAPTITLPQSIAIKDNVPAIVEPNTTGNIVNYSWLPAEGLSDSNIPDPLFNPQASTKYTLTITTADGCTASADILAKVIKGNIVVPNTFTPNGDGINDTWNIKNLDSFASSEISVFNRWGQKVYYSKGYPKPWNGTYNGKKLPASAYYYLIVINDINTKQSGWVTIIN
jgi:gliding motility-associated-like protein